MYEFFQVRWTQKPEGFVHTRNCPTLKQARSMVRDILQESKIQPKGRGYTKVGIWTPKMVRVK